MVLVDTSRWIEHFSDRDPAVRALLEQGQVLCHPFVRGELAMGNLKPREPLLRFLAELPEAISAEHYEVMELIEKFRLFAG